MSRPQPYYALGADIWVAPQRVNHNGSSITLPGFHLASVADLVHPVAAGQIAAALTLFEAAADMDRALHEVQRLVDDLTRRIDQHTRLGDHTLLVTVPIHLADMRARLQNAVAASDPVTPAAPTEQVG